MPNKENAGTTQFQRSASSQTNTGKVVRCTLVPRCTSLGSAPNTVTFPQFYIPVNFIHLELRAKLRTSEFINCSKTRLSAMPGLQSGAGGLQYEPMRIDPASVAPPKRFFRTFWRATARKIRQLKRDDPLVDL